MPLLIIVIAIAFGFWGHEVGKTKKIGPIGGAVVGALFGLIGMIIVYISGDLPDSKNDPRV